MHAQLIERGGSMRKRKKLLAMATTVTACFVGFYLSSSIKAKPATYELRPEIHVPQYTLPENRTDAARAIDAYERLMQRYMIATESNFAQIDRDIRDVVKKLDSIDNKLTALSEKTTRIENAIGIHQPRLPGSTQTLNDANRPASKGQE